MPAVAPEVPNSDPPLDEAGVAVAFPLPNDGAVLPPPPNFGAPVLAAPPKGEDVEVLPPNAEVPVAALPPPKRLLPVAGVGFAAAVWPKLNPPPADEAAGCALPNRPPEAGAVEPKGEDAAPVVLPVPPKLKPDIIDLAVQLMVMCDFVWLSSGWWK